MFINEAFAQAAETTSATGSMTGTILQLLLIFVIFYFLLIRPQQKKMKQHEATLAAIKKGDKIITGGGIFGKVTEVVNPVELKVEIAGGIVVTVDRMSVRDVIDENALLAAKNAKKTPANSNSKKQK